MRSISSTYLMYTDSDIQVSSKEHAYSEVDEEEME